MSEEYHNPFLTPVADNPVRIFKDEEQLNYYKDLWQERLGLSEWCIVAYLKDYIEDKDGTELVGRNEFQLINMTAKIYIKDQREDEDAENDEYFITTCQECVLVHELLHCKMNVFQGPPSFESTYTDYYQHQELERMARALVGLAYHLPVNWYNNTGKIRKKNAEKAEKKE